MFPALPFSQSVCLLSSCLLCSSSVPLFLLGLCTIKLLQHTKNIFAFSGFSYTIIGKRVERLDGDGYRCRCEHVHRKGVALATYEQNTVQQHSVKSAAQICVCCMFWSVRLEKIYLLMIQKMCKCF